MSLMQISIDRAVNMQIACQSVSVPSPVLRWILADMTIRQQLAFLHSVYGQNTQNRRPE